MIEREKILKSCEAALLELGINFGLDKIAVKSRKSELVFVRAVIAVWLQNAGYAHKDIAYIIGRDRATVCYLLNWQSDTWYKQKLKRGERGFRDIFTDKIYVKAKGMNIIDRVYYQYGKNEKNRYVFSAINIKEL